MSVPMVLACEPARLLAFWPFASGWMLLWGFAALIPFLIHMLSRRRYDVVTWAAMEFLLAAMRKHARRWRLEQWLLLAVRTLILLLLALAWADPIVARRGSALGRSDPAGETHWLLILDASYSMDYRPSAVTRFDMAKQLAGDLVRGAPQGDGFSLILMAASPQVIVEQPVFAREELLTEITELRRTDGGADLRSALAEAERILDRGSQQEPRLRRRRIGFFTDLGRTTWDAVGNADTQRALARLAEKAELELFDVGQEAAPHLAVTRLALSEGIVTVGHPTRLDLEVENFGSEDVTQYRLELLVDGQRIAQEHVDVPARSRSSLSATHVFPIPGQHVVEARGTPDRLVVDDQRWLSVSVQPAVEVLCVEGKPGAARHVVFALNPGPSSTARVRPAIQSDIVLLEEDLHRYDCIFLCNVGRLGSGEILSLLQFLEHGGGVVAWLGDQVVTTDQQRGAAAETETLLPARLVGPVDLGEYFFDPLEYRHPIVEPFRGHERAGLLSVPIWKYVRMELRPSSQAQIALAFNTGDPAVIEAPVGRGRVILVATDGSTSSVDRSTTPPTPWSALASWPSFPPLVQQMLRCATRGRATLRSALVGDTLRGTVRPGLADAAVTLTDPAGSVRRIPVDVNGLDSFWTFTETFRSGVYTVLAGGSSGDVQRYAVNVNTQESRLDRIDRELLPSVLRTGEADASGPITRRATARSTQLFRYVLAAVVALVLVETCLAWFLGRSTRYGSMVR